MAVIAPQRPAGAAPAPPPRRLPPRLLDLLADPRRVLLVAAALAMFAACVDVLHDPDLFWHLRLGRWILDTHSLPHAEMFSFTAAGSPMTAHEWGSEVAFAALQSVGGLLLVALAMAAVAWSGLLALALRARDRGAGLVAVALGLLLGARAAEPVLGTRPQVLTLALVCWTLLVAERHLARGGRWVWVLPPVVLVWANLHAGVVLGLGALALLVGLEAVRRLAGGPGAAPWRRMGGLAGAVGLAALLGCVNPNGPGLYRYAVSAASSERLKPITEWHSPDFSDPSNLGLLVLLASFALMLALGGRLSLRDAGMAVAGFGAALVAVRNTSLAVALALPAWTSLLQQVGARWSARRGATARGGQVGATGRGRRAMAGAVIVALGAAVSGVVVARAASDASAAGVAGAYPACTTSVLRGTDGVRVLAPYYHSGYVVEQLWPQGRVFLYGESASLGTAVFDDYLRIEAGGAEALSLLTSRGANAVLASPGALHDRLAASADWSIATRDPMGLTLFVTPQLLARLPATHC
jgi:hypothetical protein